MKNFPKFKVLCFTMILLPSLSAVCFSTDVYSKLSAGDMKILGSIQGKGTINPDKGDTAKIYFIGGHKGKYDIRIYRSSGEVVHKDSMSSVVEGMFEWVPGNTASGSYVAHISGPGIDKSKKIVIVR